ncbi:MAG: (d)CMP kinase [Clostridia bacterium]|nr:(d)CMP kinase [Clostridia bacterium]MEE1055534.1 (d)CMP kinase [Acutalibacteraceae bacterium]
MISIAIDGPAGAGKSTLSRKVAEQLGYIYVDTGALYRAVGLKFSRIGADTELNCDIEGTLKDTKVDIRFVDGEQRVFLDNEDVSGEIRTPVASMMASAVSAKPPVRAFLLEMQRLLAKENNVVMDGRDIGTVVLPNSTVKIYLTASAEDRAQRRYDELVLKGENVTFKEVYDDMVKRDYNDMHRAIAPLKQAQDAVVADTTGFSPEQSLELLLKIVREGLENR